MQVFLWALLAITVAAVAGRGPGEVPGETPAPAPVAPAVDPASAPAGRGVCSRAPSDTHASKTPGDNGFRIKVVGTQATERYVPGQVYTVTINGTYPNQRLLGFMLVAVPENAQDETTTMGTFQNFNHGLTQLAAGCPHVVTHTYQYAKAGVEVLWTAPPAGTGCVEFRATVIEYKDIWYKDDGALTRRFCEQAEPDDPEAPEPVRECCACGTGKYQMTFHGLWSRQTHPTEYPTHKRLLHWSNIVGASHGKDYTIWKYGGYASKGVKEVCEFGYPRTLEQEMRQHSRDIRTVVKTPGIWWADPHGLKQSRWARFSVDKHNHLLTMITMLGPSPDWCVGVSALDLCLPNCTWAGDMSIDLYPWDAGTDDGITYMSRNMKSDPQQKIHRISNTFPDNPASPFHGANPILPLARLTLRRIHPKPGDTSVCNETAEDFREPVDQFGDLEGDDGDLTEMERKKLMMMKSGKCAMSDWGDWSGCSTTCGVGQRFRKRMFLNPMANEDMCGSSEMETENCIGIENECEKVGDDCAVTAWSDWSPCSVTCGKGIKQRRRYYLNKMDRKRCTRNTDEREVCMTKILDCEVAVLAKNFTAICALPMVVGPCRGRFGRWYYDVTMGKCLEFTYGGCRGNNNRFRSAEECRNMCEQHMNRDTSSSQTNNNNNRQDRKRGQAGNQQRKRKRKGHHNRKQQGSEPPELQGDHNSDAVDCMVTPWSAYSECSATCGKAYRYKRRMVKREPENGGKACPKKLERKQRCKVPKCARSCVLGPWTEWSACGKTCGLDSIQERSRPILHAPERGGQACQPRLERRYCPLPACPGNAQFVSKEERMRRLSYTDQRLGR